MKQRIVIHVLMNEEKRGLKAMTVASRMKGVTGVEIVREKHLLVVIGEGVDSVELANSLRKRFGFANIVAIQTPEDDDQEFSLNESDNRTQIGYEYSTRRPYHHQPTYFTGYPVYDPNPPPVCLIL